MNPESHAMSLVNWDLFTTLTLPERLLGASERRLGGVYFAWLREVAAFQGIHFKRLLWCMRSEKGERTGRLHFHALLGGLPSTNVRSRMQAKNLWESIVGTMARVSRFEPSLPGVGYVLKGGVAYEAGKFLNTADRVTVSDSLRGALAAVHRRSCGPILHPTQAGKGLRVRSDVGEGSGNKTESISRQS